MQKIEPHPGGGRHKWEHVKDVEQRSVKRFANGAMSANIKFRAKYKCECGAVKIGPRK